MKIRDPGPAVVRAAAEGDLAALDAVLVAIQPGVFNLAVRMLGDRDDAADASQEILMKVVTHLGGFAGRAAFTTWVYQVARNHLLTASTRRRESPEVSFEGIAEKLAAGLDFAATLDPAAVASSPEDKASAREIALHCTQGMLMALDREQRLVYVLDLVFGLPSHEAAEVLGVSAEAYRQRLSRARARLDGFTTTTCGLVDPNAACRCERQVPAFAAAAAARPLHRLAVHRDERRDAERRFDAIVRMSDAAAVFRAHPDYRAPDAMIGAIRAVLHAEGWWTDRPLQ